MGMTMTEKILAAHAGLTEVAAGELVNAKLDLVLANDVTGPLAIKEFEKIGIEQVFDKEKIVLIPDHFAPAKDIDSAQQCLELKSFSRKQDLSHYYEVGRCGIEHCFLPEQGLVLPGDVVIGADSHTCTYGGLAAFSTGVGSTDLAVGMARGELWFRVPETMKIVLQGKPRNPWVTGKDYILAVIGRIGVDGARYKTLEFVGEAISNLSVDGRLTMANMAIEAGAKNGIMPADEKTIEYVRTRAQRPWQIYQSDEDAVYSEVIEIDVTNLQPQVAFPHLPSKTRDVLEAREVQIDQVVIGSCTNGRWEDLEVAASILQGKKVHPEVRVIVIPGTREIYLQAVREGLVEIFVEAGAVVSTPTCGPCLGGYMGILAKGERAVATTNRNFVGRMGHPESEVYLANPAVAAASALLGRIASPEEVCR
ncbi:MAG: 3-isopropylmalate dehydratase large subunit [Eubacteriales bacterium]|jgi:3-isopropylmalate/(R)-2-methylmalate dehydratase large subunit|nr:3-isopropylmalate dehydratase large subunit [Clostridia bacterium]MDD3074628.1 3-isopropylmalate dehydratase large subunit [Eubacteriales bacterium]MDD4145502.1 3-isopropylmalate dehydratase large subunit [Clostridia bacterium]MDD4664999.1 3-isopropylmalate dehydratase large subunit [Clostridia bacterium]